MIAARAFRVMMISSTGRFIAGSRYRKIFHGVPILTSSARCRPLLWSSDFLAKLKCNSFIRPFHAGACFYAKIYIEVENEHARSYLKNNSLYSSTLCKPTFRANHKTGCVDEVLCQDWNPCSILDVCDAFTNVSILSKRLSMDINSSALDSLCSAVVAKCVECDDSQLLCLLQCLSLWPPPATINYGKFVAIWQSLDKVCTSRIKVWDVDMKLLVMDHWACLNLVRVSRFFDSSLTKISRKLERLSPRQFVQLMFFINLRRKLPISASKFEFVHTTENLCNKLSLEELAIVSMGFFKSKTHIHNQRITETILSRLESSFRNGNPPPPDSIMLASLLKILRYSLHPTQDERLYSALEAMLPHLGNLSLLCCLHVALSGSNIQLFHEGSMRAVCQRFADEIRNARLKDIERLAFVLTLYNCDPKSSPCIYNVMVAEIRKRMMERDKEEMKWTEVEQHGECLLRFLCYLTFREIFPLDLIERAMDPNFIKMTYGDPWKKVGREVLILDTSLEIQCPQHKKRLSPELRAVLVKKYQRTLDRFTDGRKLSAAERLHVDVLEALKSLAKIPGAVKAHRILPQFERPDIVFCTDIHGKFQKLSPMPNDYEELQKCPKNNGIWHAIVTGGQNCFMKPGNQTVGIIICRMSLLEKLGYKTLLVPWFEWEGLRNGEKCDYLKQKIFSSIPKNSLD